MERNAFIEKLKDLLDCEEEIAMETGLDEIEEWDSLGIITFLAEMGKHASAQIKADDVKNARTVEDLYGLLK